MCRGGFSLGALNDLGLFTRCVSDNSAMTLAILFSLKMESLENGFVRPVSLASSHSCRSVASTLPLGVYDL